MSEVGTVRKSIAGCSEATIYAPEDRILVMVGRAMVRGAGGDATHAESSDVPSADDLVRLTSTIVHGILGQLADSSVVERADARFAISDRTSFLEVIVRSLTLSFGVSSQEGRALADALHEDLVDFLAGGGRLAGPWGRVDLSADGKMTILPRSEAGDYLDGRRSAADDGTEVSPGIP